MPPRIPVPRLQGPLSLRIRTSRPVPSTLLPLVAAPPQPQPQPQQQQHRCASILSDLRDVRGAYNKRIRRGRGPASGKGKTSGRGHKGQKQHGKVPAGFNGGQTPDEVVAGRRGFTNIFSLEMSEVNVDRIQSWIDQGRLDPSKPITIKELCSSRCLHGVKDGVKLLARNGDQLKTPINIIVSRASAAAIQAVERAGGTVTTRYYTAMSIKRVKQGLSHPFLSLMSKSEDQSWKDYQYRLPDPAGRKDIEYYRDPAHRGYLSWQLQKGQSPSLFWKTPGFGEKKTKSVAKKQAAENMLW
ncbi:ribosomal protein L15 [Verruconis gallopava]|uniref:Ribosomal protein L15 n=1 Tax=Verruconis gallopava TaxID=253628 RepID=A0A0D2AAA3_9PEZI|nr:ribosomal protein L15 [Verruconis gallopava]KIW03490.1 ribosomal protein L15 [Verruconis gallopava]